MKALSTVEIRRLRDTLIRLKLDATPKARGQIDAVLGQVRRRIGQRSRHLKKLLLLLPLLLAAPLQAQFGTALIIDGDRYIVHTSRINGTVTVESWPMAPMQQKNYDHARKYSAPARTYYAAPTPARTYRPSVRPLETPRKSSQCLVWDSGRHSVCR